MINNRRTYAGRKRWSLPGSDILHPEQESSVLFPSNAKRVRLEKLITQSDHLPTRPCSGREREHYEALQRNKFKTVLSQSCSQKLNSFHKRFRKDELWFAIKSDYRYLMDEEIIKTCQSTESDLSWDDEVHCAQPKKVSYTEFMRQFQELSDWLKQARSVQSRRTTNSSERYLNQIYYEEMLANSPQHKLFNDYGKQLMLHCPAMKDEINVRLQHISASWSSLQKSFPLLSSAINNTRLVEDIKEDISNLSVWIEQMDKYLSSLIICSTWTVTELQTKMQEHQVLQSDIESHSNEITAVLKLCNKLSCENEYSEGFKDLYNRALHIERLWHTVWLHSLEWRCLLDCACQEKKGLIVRKKSHCSDPELWNGDISKESLNKPHTFSDIGLQHQNTESDNCADTIPFSSDEYERIQTDTQTDEDSQSIYYKSDEKRHVSFYLKDCGVISDKKHLTGASNLAHKMDSPNFSENSREIRHKCESRDIGYSSEGYSDEHVEFTSSFSADARYPKLNLERSKCFNSAGLSSSNCPSASIVASQSGGQSKQSNEHSHFELSLRRSMTSAYDSNSNAGSEGDALEGNKTENASVSHDVYKSNFSSPRQFYQMTVIDVDMSCDRNDTEDYTSDNFDQIIDSNHDNFVKRCDLHYDTNISGTSPLTGQQYSCFNYNITTDNKGYSINGSSPHSNRRCADSCCEASGESSGSSDYEDFSTADSFSDSSVAVNGTLKSPYADSTDLDTEQNAPCLYTSPYQVENRSDFPSSGSKCRHIVRSSEPFSELSNPVINGFPPDLFSSTPKSCKSFYNRQTLITNNEQEISCSSDNPIKPCSVDRRNHYNSAYSSTDEAEKRDIKLNNESIFKENKFTDTDNTADYETAQYSSNVSSADEGLNPLNGTSFSENAWDMDAPYPSISEAPTEEALQWEAPHDEFEFDDDLNSTLEPVSLTSQVIATKTRTKSRHRDKKSCHVDDESDSDMDELHHMIEQSHDHLDFTRTSVNKQRNDPLKTGISLNYTKYSEHVMTCDTNLKCLSEVVDSMDPCISQVCEGEMKMINDLISSWTDLHQLASQRHVQSQELLAIYNDLMRVKSALTNILPSVEHSSYDSSSDLESAILHLQEKRLLIDKCWANLVETDQQIEKFSTGNPSISMDGIIELSSQIHSAWMSAENLCGNQLGHYQDCLERWKCTLSLIRDISLVLNRMKSHPIITCGDDTSDNDTSHIYNSSHTTQDITNSASTCVSLDKHHPINSKFVTVPLDKTILQSIKTLLVDYSMCGEKLHQLDPCLSSFSSVRSSKADDELHKSVDTLQNRFSHYSQLIHDIEEKVLKLSQVHQPESSLSLESSSLPVDTVRPFMNRVVWRATPVVVAFLTFWLLNSDSSDWWPMTINADLSYQAGPPPT